MSGFNNGVMYASNVDFTGSTTPTAQVVTNGQLLIGSTVAPNIRAGTITSSDSSITVTLGSGTIDIKAASSSLPISFVTNAGTAAASLGVLNVQGGSGLTTTGSGNTITVSANLIPLANGGTNANLTASNGGIFYSTATAGAILAGTGTANRVLLSGASTTPAWSTATYPATTTVSQLLYSSSANVVAGLATANRAVITTTAAGVPVATALATNGQLIIGSTAGAPAAANLTQGTGVVITNGSNTITIAGLNSNGFFYLNNNILNVTGDGTQYKILYDTTAFQNGTDVTYVAGTGTFTFNTTGLYEIGWHLGVLLASATFTDLEAYLTNGFGAIIYDNGGAHYDGNTFGGLTYFRSILISATATNTFQANLHVQGGTKTVGVSAPSAGAYTNYIYYKRIS